MKARNMTLPGALKVALYLAVLIVGCFGYMAAEAEDSTWPELFQQSCDGTGGCICHSQSGGINCCLNGPKHCDCATDDAWFTRTDNSITMSAAPRGENYCRTVNTENTCSFLVGDGGVTQITFDFKVSSECNDVDCTDPNDISCKTEWLAFWMFNTPWQSESEVDFIESRFGHSTGLNTNFAGHPNQGVVCEPNIIEGWRGSITAEFSGAGSEVQVSVRNSDPTNCNTGITGTGTITTPCGYFLVMDTAGGSRNSDCKIEVSNLAVQGTIVPSIRPDYGENCPGLTVK